MLTNAGLLTFNILARWKYETSRPGGGRHIIIFVDIGVLA